MEIEELLERACELAYLPNMAKVQLPGSLSNETKCRIQNMTADELAVVLREAVDQIDHGAVESIDKLVLSVLSKKLNSDEKRNRSK